MMSDNSRAPTLLTNDYVKRFYDEFRDAEMNKEYYAQKLARSKRRLKYLNIFLALFAGSSAVVGFSFWGSTILGYPVGALALGFLVGLAICLSIAKPYLGLESDIERLSSIQGVYGILASLHKDNVDDIRTKRIVTPREELAFEIMRKARISLEPKEDKPADRSLVDVCQDIVNQRYPVGHFWYPEK